MNYESASNSNMNKKAIGSMMEKAISSSQTLHLGSHVIPLVFVEVVPLITGQMGFQSTARPTLSSPRVKLLLRRKTQGSLVTSHNSVQMLWDMNEISTMPQNGTSGSPPLMCGSLSFPMDEKSNLCTACLAKSRRIVPVVFLPSDNPTEVDPIPCWIVGYGVENRGLAENSMEVIVTESTLVQVLPPQTATIRSDTQEFSTLLAVDPLPIQPVQNDWKSIMTGESCQPPLSTEMMDEVLHNHDAETVRALSLRMSMLLAQPVAIGTTVDALISRHKFQSRKRAISGALDSYFRFKHSTAGDSYPVPPPSNHDGTVNNIPTFLQEGALIVHSPHHGAGKTLLVQAIAQERLKCQAIHTIQPTSLLAQYGIHADAALESLLHAIVVRAACKQQSVCIILDHLNAMVPPLYVSRASAGDAAMPVLKAIASYLKSLTLGLKRKHEFLFPTKSPLYNLGGTGGYVLNTNVCLVGIMTCDDDGGMSKGTSISTNMSSSLDVLVAGRYRLPALSAPCRVVAFRKAFDRFNIKLDDKAMARLPILAASAVEARGRAFSDVARCLVNLVRGKAVASLEDLEVAFRILRRGASSLSKVEFAEKETKSNVGNDLFASVGGNVEAKHAIEEALALDPEKRRILRAFSLSPPTGILLYGAPGCGKSLLAKSVAKLLKSQTGSNSLFGGSFISLQASEIVRGEVGNSEKMIASAFETARSNAPAVVFIDEFQALFTERGGNGSGRLSSTLLQCMDDVCRWRDCDGELNPDSSVLDANAVERSRVVVMGATNTPWMIDKAFLRPGRFDRVVHVSLPVLDERVSILRVHVARMRLRDSANVDRICQTLAEACDGFSGADLAALCRAAAVKCLSESGTDARIEIRHFQDARKGFVPSCDVELVTKLSTWRPLK